ncbi:hypothetical protein C8R46DRAFT_1351983 [Mycena filopes]|nr:hypothetical protein C8R46DRAFT_1351983 [Mycena filopes]
MSNLKIRNSSTRRRQHPTVSLGCLSSITCVQDLGQAASLEPQKTLRAADACFLTSGLRWSTPPHLLRTHLGRARCACGPPGRRGPFAAPEVQDDVDSSAATVSPASRGVGLPCSVRASLGRRRWCPHSTGELVGVRCPHRGRRLSLASPLALPTLATGSSPGSTRAPSIKLGEGLASTTGSVSSERLLDVRLSSLVERGTRPGVWDAETPLRAIILSHGTSISAPRVSILSVGVSSPAPRLCSQLCVAPRRAFFYGAFVFLGLDGLPKVLGFVSSEADGMHALCKGTACDSIWWIGGLRKSYPWEEESSCTPALICEEVRAHEVATD